MPDRDQRGYRAMRGKKRASNRDAATRSLAGGRTTSRVQVSSRMRSDDTGPRSSARVGGRAAGSSRSVSGDSRSVAGGSSRSVSGVSRDSAGFGRNSIGAARNSSGLSRDSASFSRSSGSQRLEDASRRNGRLQDRNSVQLESRRIGDIRRSERLERAKQGSRRYLVRVLVAIGVVVALVAGWGALYNSPAFTIENVQVEGVEHLTGEEVSQLVNVPEGMTLLRVDTETIRNRLMQTAWIEDARVSRVFPATLAISVTEREIEAVVEVPNRNGSTIKSWAIAKDHTWLMPIPSADSDAAKTTSAKIYEDAAAVLHITDVPYGTSAEIGQVCTDANVNNALDIVAGLTTELAQRVVKVSAAGPAETTLTLDNGVEIAFGKAENIRDKERVILQILSDNPDAVAYINVRLVETPTWRSI